MPTVVLNPSEQLEALMSKHDLSVAHVQELTGRSRRQVYYWLDGTHNPPAWVFKLLAFHGYA